MAWYNGVHRRQERLKEGALSVTESTIEETKKQMRMQAQGAMALNVAFIGVVNGLFETVCRLGSPMADEIAQNLTLDRGYVMRWADAAFAFGFLDREGERFRLTEKGDLMRPSHPQTLMPVAVGSVLSTHMADRAAELMHTGERPGEKVLGERKNILPWFGAMLEANFSGLFEREICPSLSVFKEIDRKGGTVVDLGCGNGWYLRSLARRCSGIRGIGLDGFEENIRRATQLAREQGLSDRLEFRVGDIKTSAHGGPVDMIAMNRALHHVWDEKETVFRILRDHLAKNGAVVIWEPAWPENPVELREPRKRPLAVQNLGEHVQGNHLLRPEEIAEAFREAGMTPEIHLFSEGAEAVVVGRIA